jgi:competence protein ComEA
VSESFRDEDDERSDPRGDPEFWGGESRFERLTRPRARGGLLELVMERVREPWVGVVALVVLAVLAGVVFYEVGSGSSDAAASPAAAGAAPRRTSSTTPDPIATDPVATTGSSAPASTAGVGPKPEKRAGSTVVVHVAGAVVTPGVVTLAAGSRVIDAVEAAGGGLPNADLDRLNLAAKVVDGQRVLVQHVGDPPAAADPSVADGGTSAGGGPTGPLNLNAASQAELEQLPGIGPSLAQAIIAERTRRGGFRSLNELREVRGIGERRFADLKTLVTV